MAQLPYTLYACDCFESSAGPDEDERTFDPRSPRAPYALFPLEHLLYCEDCRQMRCPRCTVDETLAWFCPSCLFEVPSSVVKSDGNRCTRNCFNCPVCTAPLSVSSLEQPDAPSPHGGPFVLACPFCRWTTAETGIELEKHTGIFQQLARLAKDRDMPDPPTRDDRFARFARFAHLAAFYKAQLDAHAPPNPFAAHDMSFSSPSTYSRIMNLYSATSKNKKREKPPPMREAAVALEGLAVHDTAADTTAIERLKKDGWASTLSPAQKLAQLDPRVQFQDELRPVPTLLCTKRSKRCRSCRHILSKPESKITSTRYKIKLLALNHIPRITIRALPSPSSQQPLPLAVGAPSSHPPPFNYSNLRQGIPTNFVIHLSNPLFDPVRVTLATPSITPGKVHSKVTILCPEFDIGANTDVWDDALSSSAPVNKGTLVDADGALEPGKPYDRGRNWTSVVIEVVPGFLAGPSSFAGPDARPHSRPHSDLDEDDDVVEIPIFVRLEFETDVVADERALADSRAKAERETREEAFWTVVGVGRIAAV
ncbi:hypothetical protein EJ07DRAFT_164994 [Lizonia empirigonia]|nr:hypothetical protein EJ07DRAFT_164994 [Lizonia empirigonia]